MPKAAIVSYLPGGMLVEDHAQNLCYKAKISSYGR